MGQQHSGRHDRHNVTVKIVAESRSLYSIWFYCDVTCCLKGASRNVEVKPPSKSPTPEQVQQLVVLKKTCCSKCACGKWR